MEEELLNLHERFRYNIDICRKADSNAIQVSYPNKIIFGNDENVSVMYEIDYNDEACFISKYNADSLFAPSVMEVPAYAARLAVISDVMFMCHSLDISSHLVVIYDSGGNRINSNIETFDILDPPEDLENQAKETKLKAIFKKLIEGQVDCGPLAATYNVEDGYRVIVEIFSTGGF